MTKSECISALKLPLKNLGYRKKGGYWYREENDIVHCVCVLGSQWNSEDYYIEMGIAIPNKVGHAPSLGNWRVRKICSDSTGNNVNVDLEIFYSNLKKLCEIHSEKDLCKCINDICCVKIGEQYVLI